MTNDEKACHPKYSSPEEAIRKVRESRERAEAAGNPLGINGPKPEIPEPIARQIEARERKEIGQRRIAVRCDDGSLIFVWATKSGQSFRGFTDDQKWAAQEFMKIFERAHGGMKSPNMEMKVDGGGNMSAAHAARLEANQILAGIERGIGRRAYGHVLSVAYGLSVEEIHRMGGDQHAVIKSFQRAALDDLWGYFTGSFRYDRNILAIKAMTESIAAAMREE